MITKALKDVRQMLLDFGLKRQGPAFWAPASKRICMTWAPGNETRNDNTRSGLGKNNPNIFQTSLWKKRKNCP